MNTKTNNVITFDFKSSTLRTIELEGEPWFVAADVRKVLGISSAGSAYNHIHADEKCLRGRTSLGLPAGRPMMVISESGLYKLITRSDKIEAREFQDWVTREVLPSIRKTGQYKLEENRPMPLPTSMADAMRKMVSDEVRVYPIHTHEQGPVQSNTARISVGGRPRQGRETPENL